MQDIVPLLISALVGCCIAIIYVVAQPGDRSRFRIANACTVLTVVICLITRVVDDLATAFVVVGALTLVRLRAAIEDTREFGFLILSVAGGLGIGEGRYIIVIVAALLVCTLAMFLSLGQENNSEYRISFILPETEVEAFRTVIAAKCVDHRLRIRETADGKTGVRVDFTGQSVSANDLVAWLQGRSDVQDLRYEVDTGRAA